ncbi:hypothetical protein LAG90_04605 [Marinilongibacter aquaticus]|uniref:hypothetical protein n=1 Tax=Marinilongibacter aquaticus TaxID=2975157 RepID=UPI0021BD51EA|nr:hypothetical protein [Marinilongibacter aquaticus]UBM59928.1 hypothetical protein LAG90_04605 [Marinilongibacter aquaticus]
MKKLTQLLSFLVLTILGLNPTFAQVNGISYTLSPQISQHYWGKSLGISNGFTAGAQLGFGFGEMLELKANYSQGLNLKRDFSNMGIEGYSDGLISEEDVDLKRWGGELKLNLGRGGVIPFTTLGTGVQSTKLKREEGDPTKQIYVNAGGGIQFTLDDRYTLTLSATNNYINTDPYYLYLNEAERGALGLAGQEKEASMAKYWNAKASLLLYLGGRRPGELSAMDKAFQERYSSGYNGLSLPIEVTAGDINFSDKLPYPDTKFTGLSSGFDFGQYVGLRAFYLRSMEDGYFSKFDRLAVYGGEARFKLSSGQGMYPLIMLGGGVIDPLSRYTIDNTVNGANDLEMKNTPFVSGGLGLNIPFSRYFKLTGYAKAMMTSASDFLEDTQTTEQLATSWMYGLSANFVIGKKSRETEEEVSKMYDQKVMEALERERANTAQMQEEYENRIAELEQAIMDDYESGNDEGMIRKYKVKKSLMFERDQLENIRAEEAQRNAAARKYNDPSQIGLRPTDIQALVEEIKRANDMTQESIKNAFEAQEMRRTIDNEQLQMRFENMQKNMDLMNERSEMQTDALQKEIERLRQMNNGRQSQSYEGSGVDRQEIEELKKELQKEIEYENKKQELEKEASAIAESSNNFAGNAVKSKGNGSLRYEESNLETGFLIHGKPKLLIGYRRLYRMKSSNFFVVPEVAIGLGKPTIFGIFGNLMYRFGKDEKPFQPYIGGGLGLMQVDKKGETTKLELKPNVMIGANLLKFKNGKLFTDWQFRSGLRYHQLSLGYRVDLK